jgi:hypothetical protein
VTDAPLVLPASASSSPPGSAPGGDRPRRSVEPRPDLRLCLLEAIHQRDALQARRLAQRWVHRRGLVSLEAFQRITLQTVEGPEGCRWLEQQLGVDPPPALAEEVAEALEPLASVEKAFAALAAEFPALEPPSQEEPSLVQPPLDESLDKPLNALREEPLAPAPAFHPTASILAALGEDRAAPTVPPAHGPRWLPRLRFSAPSPRPAPAPEGLADLRAWLPDADDELPRAC